MRKLLVNLLIIVAVCVFAALFSRLGPLQRVELTVSDHLFRLRGQRAIDSRLSLILVDQRTVKEYGFPFSRGYYAIVANVLAAAGAEVIAFDCIFDQQQPQDKQGDQMLAEVTSNNENIIHAYNANLSDRTSISPVSSDSRIPSATIPKLLLKSGLYNTAGNMYLPYPDLLRASDSLGIISVVPSADGSIRQIPLLVRHAGQVYPGFALLIACRALGVSPVEAKLGQYVLLRGFAGNGENPPYPWKKEVKVPIDSMGQMLVNYTGGMMSLANARFSFHDVYESIASGEPIVPVSVFKDKVVLIGISDPVSYGGDNKPG